VETFEPKATSVLRPSGASGSEGLANALMEALSASCLPFKPAKGGPGACVKTRNSLMALMPSLGCLATAVMREGWGLQTTGVNSSLVWKVASVGV